MNFIKFTYKCSVNYNQLQIDYPFIIVFMCTWAYINECCKWACIQHMVSDEQTLPFSAVYGCVTITATHVGVDSAIMDAGHSVDSSVVTRVQLAALHGVTIGTTVPLGAAGITTEALIRFQDNPCRICDSVFAGTI